MENTTERPLRILAVDDNDDTLFTLESMLVRHGYEVFTAGNGQEALSRIRELYPDLILSDVVMPGMDGYQLVKAVKGDPLLRYIPIVLLTSKDALEDITYGFEQGADDYINKPFQQEELLARLKAAMRVRLIYQELKESNLANAELRSQIEERWCFSSIIGKSEAMQELYSLIAKVSDSDVPVLVTGESGTGKELVATALHYNSHRKENPFVAQNCSAFSEYLLESELFGHVKGAFTGAHRDKKGLFEVADGGTFFLDEIGEMSVALQSKLLRVLQDGSFTSVGATNSKRVDVRIVAATNRDLAKMIAANTFREDLYYRLNVINLALPPLRERKTDIPLLIEHFLENHAKRHKLQVQKQLTDEAMVFLCSYQWPGNIRELQNEVERMILMSGDDHRITVKHLSAHIFNQATSARNISEASGGTLKDAISALEKRMLRAALRDTGGNKSEAARKLGISRSNLISKVKTHELE